MPVSVHLLLSGIAVFGLGVVVLLLGKKKEKAFTEIISMGRSVYDHIGEVFNRPNVQIFKLLAYVGMTLVCIGIVIILFESGA